MKKILIHRTGGPEVMELADVPEPVAGPGEAVLRVKACSVAWPDVLIRTGTYQWMPPMPCTPGNDMGAIVESVGPGVTAVKPGDRVYLTAREMPHRGGGYTEKIAAPAAALRLVPDAVDLEHTIAIGYYSLAWAIMHEATQGFRPKSLLVVGAAGGAGSALVQLAHHLGIEVIGTVSTPEKAAFVKSLGAAHTINYRTENVVARALELTGGRGVDMLVDHIAGPDFTDYFDAMATFGLVVSLNSVGGWPAKDLFQEMRARNMRSLAFRIFAIHVFDHDPEGRRRVTDPVLPLMAQGALRPVIGARFPLAQAADAHRLLESGNYLGRIAITP
ncbi:MAG: zinc-dependent alcohol dehydrogenase family protein [Variibacter sp.]|nr:zinc-dependent alcohol dehydrogenase family protein [Variibacter sp.]